MQPPPSSVPPPGYPQPPARKGMPTWGWVLIGCIPVGLIAVVAILAAILFPVFAQAREKARETSCLSNEKQISLGLLQYVADNDNHYPAAADWMDKTQPYVMNDRIYHCPSVSHNDSAVYGYAYDSDLDGKGLDAVSTANTTATLYDSDTLGRNASDALTSLPSSGRHLHKNSIAYADGHVDSVTPPGM